MIKRSNINNTIYYNKIDTLLHQMYYFWTCRNINKYVSELMLVDILLLPMLDSETSDMFQIKKISGNNNYINDTNIYKFVNINNYEYYLYISYIHNMYNVTVKKVGANKTHELGKTESIFEILEILKDLSIYNVPNIKFENNFYYNDPLYINYYLTNAINDNHYIVWCHTSFQYILITALRYLSNKNEELCTLLKHLVFYFATKDDEPMKLNITNNKIYYYLYKTFCNFYEKPYKELWYYDLKWHKINNESNKLLEENILCNILKERFILSDTENEYKNFMINHGAYDGRSTIFNMTYILFNILLYYYDKK